MPEADRDEIVKGLRAICGDRPFEIRVPNIPGRFKQTASGYFNCPEIAADAIVEIDRKHQPKAVYVTLNEIHEACFDRSPNRFTLGPQNTTSDSDIVRRRWLPIDIDPVRVAGVNATADERRAAHKRLDEVIELICGAIGWPKPVSGMTGNGAMALFRIDAPNDDATRDMVRETLRMFSMFFDDDRAKIDQAVWNAARIWKVPGTVARKGPASEARSHEVARLFNDRAEPLTADSWRAELDWFKGAAPQKNYKGKAVRKPIDLEAWCVEHGVAVRDVAPWRGARKFVLEHCPFDNNHDGTSVALFQFDSGAIMFKCLHDSCSHRTWRDLRDHVGDTRPAGVGGAHVPKDFGGLTNLEQGGAPRDITAISDELFDYTDEWPRKCAGQLFVVQNGEVRWLTKQSELFAWLHETLGVVWLSKQGSVTKEEFFGHLLGRATTYDDVQVYPHWPSRPRSYYLKRWSANGDGKALAGLVDFFRPRNREDVAVLKSLFVTLFWGGDGGKRPMFVITSEDGQGTGKTTLAKTAANLVGGSIDLRTSEKPNSWTDRVLSPGARGHRVALLDNVKDMRIDSQELEELITCREISGRQMFVGEGRRENNLTYLCTLNTSGMSSDLAQRSYQVELVKPSYDPRWDAKLEEYVKAHHERIVADVGAVLTKEVPQTNTTLSTRWGAWEKNVLQRSHGGDIDPIIKHNLEVQQALDDDAHPYSEFLNELKQLLAMRLAEENDVQSPLDPSGDPEKQVLLLKMPIVARAWTNAVKGADARPMSHNYVGKLVKQGIAKGYNAINVDTADGTRKHESLMYHKSRAGRYYVWVGQYSIDGFDPSNIKAYKVWE